MDKILSIDLSSDQVSAVVAGGSYDAAQLIAGKLIDLSDDQQFIQDLFSSENRNFSEDDQSEDAGFVNPIIEKLKARLSPLYDLYLEHQKDIIQVVVIIPPESFFSMNLELPFGSDSAISKIIEFEVQDLIPFEVSEFVVDFKKNAQIDSNTYDVHASLIPQRNIINLLGLFSELMIEPTHITIPSAVLGSICNANQSQLILLKTNDIVHIGTAILGKLHASQVITIHEHGKFPKSSLVMLLEQSKERYGTDLTAIKVIAGPEFKAQIEEITDLPVILEDKAESTGQENLIAWLGAKVVLDKQDSLITNFRTGKFRYSPIGKTTKQFLQRTWIYFLPFFVALMVAPTAVYFWRANKISSLKSDITTEIKEHLPNSNLPQGKELDYLTGQTNSIKGSLENLGSAAKTQPLDVFLRINEIFESIGNAKTKYDLTKIDINGQKVEIQGSAPDYRIGEKIERILKKEPTFCHVKKESNSSRTASRQFKFTITLC